MIQEELILVLEGVAHIHERDVLQVVLLDDPLRKLATEVGDDGGSGGPRFQAKSRWPFHDFFSFF